MPRTVLVAAGGLVGSVCRYWCAGAVQRWNGAAFPLGTLAVNVAGSFLIGWFMSLSLERGVLGADARTLWTVGFCGGFTTMSTLSYETLTMLRDGELVFAAGNALGSVAACLLATWLGGVAARVL